VQLGCHRGRAVIGAAKRQQGWPLQLAAIVVLVVGGACKPVHQSCTVSTRRHRADKAHQGGRGLRGKPGRQPRASNWRAIAGKRCCGLHLKQRRVNTRTEVYARSVAGVAGGLYSLWGAGSARPRPEPRSGIHERTGGGERQAPNDQGSAANRRAQLEAGAECPVDSGKRPHEAVVSTHIYFGERRQSRDRREYNRAVGARDCANDAKDTAAHSKQTRWGRGGREYCQWVVASQPGAGKGGTDEEARCRTPQR